MLHEATARLLARCVCIVLMGGDERSRQMRYCLRLAALLHDIGHGPYSHAAEFAMPNVRELFPDSAENRRASHEDYTVAILLNSSLSERVAENFSFTSRHIAALIRAMKSCTCNWPAVATCGAGTGKRLCMSAVNALNVCEY